MGIYGHRYGQNTPQLGNIDHQWFSSLGNIISICLQLRKAELQAKEDRRALDHSEKILRNIYKNLPVGIELYDKDGYLVDMNDKELEIFGLADMKEALGVSLFENPNIPEDVKEKLRARENVDFSINYDFSKIDRYVTSKKKRCYQSSNQKWLCFTIRRINSAITCLSI